MNYLRPNGIHHSTTTVLNSVFICSIGLVESTSDAREFLLHIRKEMPDASHHPYAFRVGYGKSVTDGMSDDGEPTGTAGPPIMAVLRGADIGDTIVVVTRYFGGTKLGTGGLVRAYTEAAQAGLGDLKTEYKTTTSKFSLELPYPLYEKVSHLIQKYEGQIEDRVFAATVTVVFNMSQKHLIEFQHVLDEITSGQIVPTLLS